MIDIEAMARDVAIGESNKDGQIGRHPDRTSYGANCAKEMAKRLSQECVIVPKEPTKVMISNGLVEMDKCDLWCYYGDSRTTERPESSDAVDIYKAMIATVENKDG